MRLRTRTALLLALTAGAVPAAGQSPDTTVADTFDLPGIVVTATRVPLARESLPTTVTVWTGDQLRAQGVRTVADALRQVPSATVARAGGPGAQTSLFLRGGESDYVKVLIDGVPVNDPGGAYDFADLTTDQVERIEVVRGPVSVLYGSDAVAGVIQVFTRRGRGAPSITAQILGGQGQERSPRDRSTDGGTASAPDPGAYGLLEAETTISGAAGALAYTLGGARSWSQGLYPFNNDRGLNSGTARLAWTPGSGTELAVSTRLSDSRSHFPTDGTGALVDRNARIDRQLWTTSLVAGFRLHNRIDARLQAGLVTRDQRTRDPQDGPADTLGTFASTLDWGVTRRSLDARVDIELPRSTATLGVAWEQADAATRYSSRSPFGPYDARADYHRSSRGAYAQLLAIVHGVHVTAGGRVDQSETYGAFGTYRLGLAMEPVGGNRIRAAVGRGFREPAFDQVFGSGFGDLGNPGLEPERSRSWEVGVEQEIGPTSVGATWFDQRFSQLIQFTFAPPVEGDPNYFNVGAASARGLELEARGEVGRLAVSASYTALTTEVLDPGLASDAGFVEGEVLLRRPSRTGTLTARYAAEAGSLGVTVNAVGERADLDFGDGFPAPRVTLRGYATVNLSAEHRLPAPGPVTMVLLRIENVLNAKYQTVSGFPGLGRVVRLGARVEVR